MLNDFHENRTVNGQGLAAARNSPDEGVITPTNSALREAIVKLSNDSLVTKLVRVLRHKSHHLMATGLSALAIADEFLVRSSEQLVHTDRIVKRIGLLGGDPYFSPDTLLAHRHANCDESNDLKTMIRVNSIAEQLAVRTYRQMIELVGKKDSAPHAACGRISWPRKGNTLTSLTIDLNNN